MITDLIELIQNTFFTVWHKVWAVISWPFMKLWHMFQDGDFIIKVVIAVIVVPLLLLYFFFFLSAARISDYDLDYASKIIVPATQEASDASETSTSNTLEANASDKACKRSAIVDITADLVDFNVNRNTWLANKPLYKMGFFGLVSWEETWVMDNKAAFQQGIHQAVKLTTIELANAMGRLRGTSAADKDLEDARSHAHFDPATWYLNPFGRQPFGPTTPSTSYYRKAIDNLNAFNNNLENCTSAFDARADNLLLFLDRIAKDIGDTTAQLRTHAEMSNWGWFDRRSDDIFWHASGQLYAYHGLIQAAKHDFADVIKTKRVEDLWMQMEEQFRQTAELSPIIVSNGAEDGWIMPSHLTTIGFYILRARSNLVEIRSVLDR